MVKNILITILISNSVFALTSNAEIQDMNEKGYKVADKELNKVYKVIIKNLKGDKKERNNIKKAQRAWIKYRDTECYAYAAPYRDGTGEYTMISECLWDMTEKRTKQLREHFIY